MKKIDFADIYKLNAGENVLFLMGHYNEALDCYNPPLNICIQNMDYMIPKLDEMGINYLFVLNVFSNIQDFTTENLIQMRDILDGEIKKRRSNT